MIKVVMAFSTVCLATLALAGSAVAADTPELQVIPYVTGLARQTDTELDLTIPAAAAAMAKVVIYAPAGYGATLALPAGTKIANATATVDAGGTTLALNGQAVADTPEKYTTDPRAQACAPGAHAAVWLLQLPFQSQTLTLPVYVDPTTAGETGLGAYKLQVCFPSPYVPEAEGGAPFGAKLIEADIDFTTGFTNPPTANVYIWRALVTPYTVGTGTRNDAGTYELRSVAFIPVVFTLKARYDKKKRVAVLSGKLKLSGVVPPNVEVAVVGGPTTQVSKWKLIGFGRGKKGSYTLRKKLKRSTYMAALVLPASDTCFDGQPSVAPAGCVRETTAPAISNLAHLIVPKRRR